MSFLTRRRSPALTPPSCQCHWLPGAGAGRRARRPRAAALASGAASLDPGADRSAVGSQLLTLPGIGPWTAGYIRMRALSDPDVFLPGDVGVLRALQSAGGGARSAA